MKAIFSIARNNFGVLGAALAGIVLAGCANGPEKNDADLMSPKKLYSEAQAEMSSSNFDNAIKLLEKLEGKAAGTPLEQQAKLDQAYAYYRSDQSVMAIATIDHFIRQHPASPAMDYALYLKGLANSQDKLGFLGFLSDQDLSERDQSATKGAFLAFEELVRRFPQSRYSSDARMRMGHIVNSLAQYEVNIANYYYRRGAYVAAVNRAQNAIADYREVPALEEAVYILYRAYDALNLTDLRDDARRIMERSFPTSTYLKNGFREKNRLLGLW